MSNLETNLLLERQLLLQLGDRLKRHRNAQKLGAVEVAARAGISRNTLRAIETGDPAPSIGNYLRVMAVLGISSDLALLAGDSLRPAPAGSAGARSQRAAPIVQINVSADPTRHQLQDLQSLALHEEAVRLIKTNPALSSQALETVRRWLSAGDSRSATLWREWGSILQAGTWRKVLGSTRRAQQLRQTSPLVTILPDERRQHILKQVSDLKNGVTISNQLSKESL